MAKTFIKEVFESIQGEGHYVGEKQIFIRFCSCNLNCDYCDTDFVANTTFSTNNSLGFIGNPVSHLDLAKIINNYSAKVVSLTGGEPLLEAEFLSEFLPLLNTKRIYLETNGTLPDKLNQVIKLTDVVSMDIKLSCSTKQPNQFENNEKFIQIAKAANKEIFAKIVLDKNYSKEEILMAIGILKKYNIPLILQPMDCKDKSNELSKEELLQLFNFTFENYADTRLIPQVHKFLKLM